MRVSADYPWRTPRTWDCHCSRYRVCLLVILIFVPSAAVGLEYEKRKNWNEMLFGIQGWYRTDNRKQRQFKQSPALADRRDTSLAALLLFVRSSRKSLVSPPMSDALSNCWGILKIRGQGSWQRRGYVIWMLKPSSSRDPEKRKIRENWRRNLTLSWYSSVPWVVPSGRSTRCRRSLLKPDARLTRVWMALAVGNNRDATDAL